MYGIVNEFTDGIRRQKKANFNIYREFLIQKNFNSYIEE